MSNESDDELYRKHSDQFETFVDCGLVLVFLSCLFPPLGLFILVGMGTEHLYAKRQARKDREKGERKVAAARAAAEAETKQRRVHELALAEARRPLVSPPPPPPPPPPTAEEVAAAATARYEKKLLVIDASPMDETEKKAARAEAKKKYLREIGGLL